MDNRQATALRDAAAAERLATYLKDLRAPRGEVRRCIARLREVALRHYGYDYYYLNLLSVLGDSTPPHRVAALAGTAVRHKLWGGWEFGNRVLAFLEGVEREWKSRTVAWDLARVHATLRRGRGLVIVTVHFGAFRDIAARLTVEGFAVALGVDNDSAGKLRDLLSAGAAHHAHHPFAFGRGSIRIVDLEQDPAAGLRLVQALRRNEIAVVMADGNSGRDGPRGQSNRCDISFMRRPLRVKYGVLNIAAAARSPVLPVMATELSQGGGRVEEDVDEYGEPSTAGPRACPQHAATTMERMYAFFGAHILHAPEAWEGAGRLHRSRPVPEGPLVGPSDRDRAREAVRRSVRLTLDGTHAVVMRQNGCVALVDAPTLRAYRVVEQMPLLHLLVQQGTSSTAPWRAALDDMDLRTLSVLGSWLRLGLVREHPAAGAECRVTSVPRAVLA
jgi:predicted LPLAT superfamily acyltransferase